MHKMCLKTPYIVFSIINSALHWTMSLQHGTEAPESTSADSPRPSLRTSPEGRPSLGGANNRAGASGGNETEVKGAVRKDPAPENKVQPDLLSTPLQQLGREGNQAPDKAGADFKIKGPGPDDAGGKGPVRVDPEPADNGASQHVSPSVPPSKPRRRQSG